MDDEIQSFLKVWITAISGLCYCYYIAARIPKGFFRLLSILPIFYLFLILPFNLSFFHLRGPTTFFLVWIANFRLLLFSFNQGPLALSPNIFHFICMASLPINVKQPSPSIQTKNNTNPPHKSTTKIENPQNNHLFPNSLLMSLKVLVLTMIIWACDYRENLHPNLFLALYFCHMYIGMELMLSLSAATARTIFGFEIEPHFKKPYLSTSLQDFWGRRWNLVVSSILRTTVYDPLRRFSNRFVGTTCGTQAARWVTFLVSGLMHDLIFYYLVLAPPTWQVTGFFVLHGTCTVVEVAAKKMMLHRGWRLHGAVSGPLVVAFVAVTAKWLFFPQLVSNDADRKAIEERKIMADFVKSKLASHLF